MSCFNTRSCCQSYFGGFHQISHAKQNKALDNFLASLKIVSYFTVAVPLAILALCFGAFCISNMIKLAGRVSKKENNSNLDKKITKQATSTLLSSKSESRQSGVKGSKLSAIPAGSEANPLTSNNFSENSSPIFLSQGAIIETVTEPVGTIDGFSASAIDPSGDVGLEIFASSMIGAIVEEADDDEQVPLEEDPTYQKFLNEMQQGFIFERESDKYKEKKSYCVDTLTPIKDGATFLGEGSSSVVQEASCFVLSKEGKMLEKKVAVRVNKKDQKKVDNQENRILNKIGKSRGIVPASKTIEYREYRAEATKMFSGDLNSQAFQSFIQSKNSVDAGKYKIKGLQDALTGLVAAHAKGCVHQDIKTGNILFDEKGMYLADWGLARSPECFRRSINSYSSQSRGRAPAFSKQNNMFCFLHGTQRYMFATDADKIRSTQGLNVVIDVRKKMDVAALGLVFSGILSSGKELSLDSFNMIPAELVLHRGQVLIGGFAEGKEEAVYQSIENTHGKGTADLIRSMLDADSSNRPTAEDCLNQLNNLYPEIT